MELKLGVDWIQKLGKKLKEIGDERKAQIDEINRVLTIDPYELARLYIEPSLQPYNPANAESDGVDEEDIRFMIPSREWLDPFIQRGGRRDGRHVAFVLSDAGMGKTSLLAMLAMTAATDFWPTDIRFRLMKLGENSLDNIDEISDERNTVLLLDSLDEDKTAFGRIEERIVEILKATEHFKKVIVTCRTQFFPGGNTFQRDGGRIKISGFSCKVIYLSLFDDEQVTEYLAKVFHGRVDERMRAEELVPKMKSLRMRPMLLAHIEDLIEREPQGGEWNAYRMHEALVEAWLDREERKGLVKAEELRLGCWELALNLQKSGDFALSPEKLEEHLIENEIPKGIEGVVDFGGRSLLNKNSDGEYRFAHYSIQEFLVVQRMVEKPGEVAAYCKEIRWSDELIAFLVAWMLEDPSARLRGELAAGLTGVTEWKRFGGVGFVGVDLEGAVLQGVDLQAVLQGVDLQGVGLQGANLQGADLRGADLRGADLRGADLWRANLWRANLWRANLRRANLRRANLQGANLQGAELQGADLRRAKVNDTQLQLTIGEYLR